MIRIQMIDESDMVKPTRSRIMSSVRSKNTAPEIIVRKICHRLGYRFRLHRKDIPGTPDLVFPRLHKVVLVHGCFWHRHEGCHKATMPQTRQHFWKEKFVANIRRDNKNIDALRALGWEVEIIWECETKELDELSKKLLGFLQ